MREQSSIRASAPAELAHALGLGGVESQEWQAQYGLLKKLRQAVSEGLVTYAEAVRPVAE